MGLDVLDRFLHAGDLLGVVVGNLDPELLLERHDQLHGVERIGPEVVDERRIRRDFFFVHPELLHDDALHLVSDGHSILLRGIVTRSRHYMYIPPFTARVCPVIYDASSDARKQTAAAMSSGVPR